MLRIVTKLSLKLSENLHPGYPKDVPSFPSPNQANTIKNLINARKIAILITIKMDGKSFEEVLAIGGAVVQAPIFVTLKTNNAGLDIKVDRTIFRYSSYLML